MIKIVRTNSENADFIELVQLLDKELKERDGEDHSFYAQFNNIDVLKHTLVAYQNDIPLGCGAFKQIEEGTVEIKRMYVLPDHRGKGIAVQVLKALEDWSKELKYNKCVLETGLQQPEAIALYKKSNYQIIPNYGQYKGIENSVCFEKNI